MTHVVFISKEEQLAVDAVLEQEQRGEEPIVEEDAEEDGDGKNSIDTESVDAGNSKKSESDSSADDDDNSSDHLGDTNDSSDGNDDEVDEDKTSADTEASADVATESITLNKVIASYSEVESSVVATEAFSEIGAKIWSATKYLGVLGIQYGPGAFKFVTKGVVALVSQCAKGLYFGSIAISKFADAKMHSYTKSRKDILRIRQVVLSMSDAEPSGSYKDVRRIQYLHINNMGVDASLSHFSTFLTRHIKNMTNNVESSLLSINLLIGKVLSGYTESPNAVMTEQNATIGMSKLSIAGYKEPNKNLDTYTYKMDLPGSLRLMAYLPKAGLKEHDDIENAYKNSSMFLANTLNKEPVKEIQYLNKHELLMVLDNLEKLCVIGIAQDKNIRTIQNTRRSIMFSIKGFVVHLLKIKRVVTIRDTLADFVTLKVSFIDKCYIKSLFDVNDLSIKVINSGIAFAKQNAKSLSKVSK